MKYFVIEVYYYGVYIVVGLLGTRLTQQICWRAYAVHAFCQTSNNQLQVKFMKNQVQFVQFYVGKITVNTYI